MSPPIDRVSPEEEDSVAPEADERNSNEYLRKTSLAILQVKMEGDKPSNLSKTQNAKKTIR